MADMNKQDLWPGTFGLAAEDSPMDLLQQQATLLESKTDGLVRAVVEDTTEASVGFVLHSELSARFILVAPYLHGYRYILFRISYPVVLYPVEIKDTPLPDLDFTKAASASELCDKLSEILKAPETQRIISSLMRESAARKGA